MEGIQLFQVSPEELKRDILNSLKSYLGEIKQHFQLKEPVEYLTRKETAEIFSVDISTIHNWTKKGWLKSYGLGNRVYYKRHELDKAIKQLNFKSKKGGQDD